MRCSGHNKSLSACFYGLVSNRDAGTEVHYGGTAPLTFERGSNGGTGALTYQYHKYVIS